MPSACEALDTAEKQGSVVPTALLCYGYGAVYTMGGLMWHGQPQANYPALSLSGPKATICSSSTFNSV